MVDHGVEVDLLLDDEAQTVVGAHGCLVEGVLHVLVRIRGGNLGLFLH